MNAIGLWAIAAESPDRTAVIEPTGAAVTYAELAREADRYGRGLQAQKKQEEGFAIFKINVKKHPNEWYSHGELARMASAKGDFDTATKEMKIALNGAPDFAKSGIQGLIGRLEKKEDIN